MKKRFVFLSITFVLATGTFHLFSQQQTGEGQVIQIFSCCGLNTMRVETTAQFVANGCPANDGYIINPGDPANIAYQSLLLGAYLSGKHVLLLLGPPGTCYAGRPQINGVVACEAAYGTCLNDKSLKGGSGGSDK